MVAVLGFSKQEILAAVTDMYTLVAEKPRAPLHFPVGADACRLAGYRDDQIDSLPLTALESFAGVGCPFRAEVIRPGHRVLDVGSGAGTDAIIAARMVGETGRVYALDLTPAMRRKLQATLSMAAIDNVEILAGNAEQIPLPEASVDVVTSNGVLNLVPDKRGAIAEIFRVLKPGGRVQLADIVIASPVTPDCEDDPQLWAECVVGATVDQRYLEMFRDAGFEDVEVLRDYDYFEHSPSPETREVAAQFGAHAFELRMRRGEHEPSKILQWARRLDPRRLLRDIRLRGLAGMLSLAMALLACYGTLGLVGLMSALGVGLAVDEGIWAGAILSFAWLACAVIALGVRKHGSFGPLVFGLAGSGTLTYTLLLDYRLAIEIAGFALLAIATAYDYRQRRWSTVRNRERKNRQHR